MAAEVWERVIEVLKEDFIFLSAISNVGLLYVSSFAYYKSTSFDMAFYIHLPEFISFPEEYINGHNETCDTIKN